MRWHTGMYERVLIAALLACAHATAVTSSFSTASANLSSFSRSTHSHRNTTQVGGPAAVITVGNVAGITTPHQPGFVPTTIANGQQRPSVPLPGWPVFWTQSSAIPISIQQTAPTTDVSQTTAPNTPFEVEGGGDSSSPTKSPSSSTWSILGGTSLPEVPSGSLVTYQGMTMTVEATERSNSYLLVNAQTTLTAVAMAVPGAPPKTTSGLSTPSVAASSTDLSSISSAATAATTSSVALAAAAESSMKAASTKRQLDYGLLGALGLLASLYNSLS